MKDNKTDNRKNNKSVREYYENDVLVKVFPYIPPKKNEKTFRIKLLNASTWYQRRMTCANFNFAI